MMFTSIGLAYNYTLSQVCIILAVAFLCILRWQKKERSYLFLVLNHIPLLLTIFKAGSGALPALLPG